MALVVLVAVAGFSACVQAQNDADMPTGTSATNPAASPLSTARVPWTIDFEPAIWFTAPNGNLRLAGNSTTGNGQSFTVDDLNLDSTRVSPFGEIQARRGKWRLTLSGFNFDLNNQGVRVGRAGQIGSASFQAGDTLRSSMDLLSLSADVGYEIYTSSKGSLDSGAPKYRASVILLGGIRSIDTTFRSEVFRPGTSNPVATTQSDALHAHPYAGVRLEMELFEDFTIDLLSTLGGLTTGDTESWSSDILVGFQWNPTPHFGAQIGYRQLLLGIEQNNAPTEFSWQGGMAGLYGGTVIRF